MPNYRRVKLEGATVAITIVTYKRLPILLKPKSQQILRFVWTDVAKRLPFTTEAICFLPNHIHAMISLPENDWNYSIRIREIKRRFTRAYLKSFGEHEERNKSRVDKKEATIWQRRFWEHTIRDEIDYQNHFDYIHYNPVNHGFVDNVSSWEWSSFHRYVRLGVYDEDWGSNYSIKGNSSDYGE